MKHEKKLAALPWAEYPESLNVSREANGAAVLTLSGKDTCNIYTVTFFDLPSRAPRVRVFISDKDNIRVQVPGREKLSSASLQNVDNIDAANGRGWMYFPLWGGYSPHTAINATDSEAVIKRLGRKDHGRNEDIADSINLAQNHIKSLSAGKRHKKHLSDAQQIYRKVPTLTRQDLRYVSRTLFPAYMFYAHDKGYCTACDSCINLTYRYKQVHGEKAICPKCGAAVTMYKAHCGRKGLFHYADFARLVSVQGGIIAAKYMAEKNYTGYEDSENKIRVCLSELLYMDFDNHRVRRVVIRYSWGPVCKPYPDIVSGCVFSGGDHIPSLPFDPALISERKCTAWIMTCGMNNTRIINMLSLVCRSPVTEQLYKAGYSRLVSDACLGYIAAWDIKAKTVSTALGLRDRYAAYAKAYRNISNTELSGLRITAHLGLVPDIGTIYTVANHSSDIALMRRRGLSSNILSRVVKYILEDESYGHYIWSDYNDYLAQMNLLKYDISDTGNLFPRDFNAAHAKLSTLIKYKKSERLESMLSARMKDLEKRYSMLTGGLVIRPVRSVMELISEGETLHHCVGSYADRYASGSTDIVVIRQASAPDNPFYTLEVRNNRVIQVRGMRNCAPTDEVNAAVKQLEQYITNKKKREKRTCQIIQ